MSIIITRLILSLYGIGCFLFFLRIISLVQTGKTIKIKDVTNILLFPIIILTKSGRAELRTTLTETMENKND